MLLLLLYFITRYLAYQSQRLINLRIKIRDCVDLEQLSARQLYYKLYSFRFNNSQ